MSKITFHRNHKIKDCVGYADYVVNPDRHKKRGEELARFGDGSYATHSNIPIEDHMEFWKMLQTESINCEYAAHASIVYIPQDIQDAYRAGDENPLRQFVADYATDFEQRYPGIIYEFAVHDNDGNMHLHRIDCERKIIDLSRVPEITTTKSRARYLVDGKQSTKKKYLEAQASGNLNIEFQPAHETPTIKNQRFGAKETFFKDKNFGKIEQTALMNLFNRLPYISHGWKDKLEDGYLPQKHVAKGDPTKYYGIAANLEYNELVKAHNANLDEIRATEREVEIAQVKLNNYKVLLAGEKARKGQPTPVIKPEPVIEPKKESQPISKPISKPAETISKPADKIPAHQEKVAEIAPKAPVWVNPYPAPTNEQLLALSECVKIPEITKQISTLRNQTKGMENNLENNQIIKDNPKLYSKVAQLEQSLEKTKRGLEYEDSNGSGLVKIGVRLTATAKNLVHSVAGDEATVQFYRENHLTEKEEKHFRAKIKTNKGLIQELVGEIKRMYHHICQILGLRPKNATKLSEIAQEVQIHQATLNAQIQPFYDAQKAHEREVLGTTTKDLKAKTQEQAQKEHKFTVENIKNKTSL